MKKLQLILGIVFGLTAASSGQAEALSAVSLQVHNPTGGSPSSPEPAGVKSQFIMSNDSSAGITIDSILWEFASPVFVDSAAGSPGFGGFRDYEVAPADTYGGSGSGEFQTTVLADSDVLTGYTGPTSFTDGATSLFLSFNDFDDGEAFGFWTDLDTTNNDKGRVGNSDFNGSKTTVTFSDGSVLNYTWVLPDNDGRSFYAQAEGENSHAIPEPGTMALLGSGLLGALARRKISV